MVNLNFDVRNVSLIKKKQKHSIYHNDVAKKMHL